jgi:bifunctional non-homologous end joining protein LigD
MLLSEADRPFSGPDWLFEVKWDGIRCIAAGGRLYTRRGIEVSQRFPEVRDAVPDGAVLDGEVVVAVGGRPDFDAVMDRMRRDPARGASGPPACLVAFDLLALGEQGHDLMRRPLAERRHRLLEAVRPGPALAVNPAVAADGLALWEQVLERAWEGMVAKRADSVYRPGERSRDWVRVKNRRTCDGLLVGTRPGGYLVVADPDNPARVVATVISGVPRALWEGCAEGRIPLPQPCRLTHVGVTARGHLREPAFAGLVAAKAAPESPEPAVVRPAT